jgi:hypothetical protein
LNFVFCLWFVHIIGFQFVGFVKDNELAQLYKVQIDEPHRTKPAKCDVVQCGLLVILVGVGTLYLIEFVRFIFFLRKPIKLNRLHLYIWERFVIPPYKNLIYCPSVEYPNFRNSSKSRLMCDCDPNRALQTLPIVGIYIGLNLIPELLINLVQVKDD